MKTKSILLFLPILLILFSCNSNQPEQLNMQNFYAWCIVPFDNQNRTPEQRIEMLEDLGFVSYAYDWREKHLPEMVTELKLAKENGIEVNAVWMWIDKNDSIGNLSVNNEKVFSSIKDAGLKTQIWMSFPEDYFETLTDTESLERAGNMIAYLSKRANEIGCNLALYNHGGWFGNPENLVKIIQSLSEHEIGIIFNFHHAHNLLGNFDALVKNMKPYLWAVNLNGMNPAGPKILTIGEGTEEAEMIEILVENGFNGPFGILGHREDADVEKVLQANLDGLKSILKNN